MTELLRHASGGASTTSSTGSTEQSQSEQERDYANMGDNFQALGWRVVLLLQFQPQFVIVILISIYTSFICSLMDVTYAYGAPNKKVPNVYAPIGTDVIFCFDLIYAVDILLAIMYKNTEWIEMQHLHDERHALMLVLDIISIIPLDPMYHSLTNCSMQVISIIRLRYVLRIFRLTSKINRIKDTIGTNHFLTELLDFFITTSLILVVSSCIWYFINCQSKCEYKDSKIIEAFFMMSGKITSRGYPTAAPKDMSTYFLNIITNLFSFVYISGFAIGSFLMAVIQSIKTKNLYENARAAITKKMKLTKIQDDLCFETNEIYFSLFWKCRQGIVFDNFHVNIIPEIMAKEINLDISWDALKHSHLFRDKEVHFLRFVAPYMKQIFMIPGETIYKRNQFKSSMVYVATGVIQILSEEDGESPILSLSGGTCIGESTLFLDYPSTCSVICKTYCELYVLHRKDFMKILMKYPQEVREMRKHIENRYNNAKEYQELLDFSYDKDHKKREVLIMKWLKATLHDLMSKDVYPSDDEKIILTLDERETINEFDKLLFCCNYLDMLVIAEEIELVTDTVFLRTSCPCILQPDSFIVNTWKNLIALAAFTFGVIYPYYAAFQPKTTNAYLIFSYIITVLWILDIYINLSTGIRTREGIIAKIAHITLNKCPTLEFAMDVFAAFPLELSALFVAGYPGSQLFILLQAPRLFKLYKIGKLFDEDSTSFNVITRAYLKYIIYMLLLTYYIAATLYLKLCYSFVCDTNNVFVNYIQKIAGTDNIKYIIMFFYIAMQQTTGVTVPIHEKGVFNSLFIIVVIIAMVATLFYITAASHIAATDALKRYNILRLREYTASVLKAIENANVKPRRYGDVVSFIRGQIAYNEAADILYPPQTLYKYYVHPVLIREIRRQALIEYLQINPIFKDLPNELLGNIASISFVNTSVPGKVITYSGEICKEMHIIMNGFCEIYASSEEERKTIGPGSSLSDTEFFCGIPVVNNVVTLTHCRFASFKYERVIHKFQMYPKEFMELQSIANATIDAANLEGLTNNENTGIDNESTQLISEEDISFKHFGYGLDLDTKEGKNFHQYFNKFGFFNCMRYIVLRHTITPYGRFMHYWEISRCIFAFITAILTPIAYLPTCTFCHWNYILSFLDITAWLDIFVRHYVCYFDEKGVEITHPVKTALHYWKHGFIIDLLGVLPFELLLASLFKPKINNRQRVFLQMTRILQFHRVLGGLSYLNQYLLSPSHVWALIKYIPLIVVFIIAAGSMVINRRCTFDPSIPATDNFTAGMSCIIGTWISEGSASKPLTPIRTQLYGIYAMTVLITGPGLGGFPLQRAEEAFNVVICNCVGYWLFIYITARVIADNLFRNVDFTSYQDAMHSLVQFLSYRRIDAKLKNEVIQHFEHVWKKKLGKDLHKTITNFNFALQEDILLDVYGKTMKESLIFSQANDSFLRSLLITVKHTFIMKRGIISQVNTINKKIYFIFKGQVEVLGPDYNRLLILPVGSIFGNLDKCPRSRQTLTMVAKGHVELLTVNTEIFYSILSNYQKLYKEFRKLTVINTDYLLGAPPPMMHEGSLMIKSNVTFSKSFVSHSRANDFLQQIKQFYAIYVWEYIILILVCYFGSVFELYRITVQENSNLSVVFLYFLDSLFIINIILKFRTAYEDEFGVLITNKRKIARRYLRNCTGFPLQFASVLPIEIIALFFPHLKLRWKIWNYLRCNRFLRIYFILKYFRKKNKQLNINVHFMRTLSILVWINVLLQVITSLLLTASCINPAHSLMPPIKCNWEAKTAKEKFKTYANQFSVVLYIFTATSIEEYFPNSPLLILLMISFLIGSKFLVIHVVGEVAATLNIVLKKRTSYEKHMYRIKEHIVRERISPALLERVMVYIHILWKRKGGLQFPVLLLDAPYYLREGVLNSMFGCHLRRHELFKRCHVDLIRQIAAQMQTRTFFPGDYIAFINDSDGCMYFIHEGAVDALSEDDLYDEKIDKILYAGDVFGLEQGLYSNIGHEFSYRANRHTLILMLERERWIHLLDFFPASRSILIKKNN